MQGKGEHSVPKRIKNFFTENFEFLTTFDNLDRTLGSIGFLFLFILVGIVLKLKAGWHCSFVTTNQKSHILVVDERAGKISRVPELLLTSDL